MGPLVSAGGIHVPAPHVRTLEIELYLLRKEYAFPPGEEFKWSPGRHAHESNGGSDRVGYRGMGVLLHPARVGRPADD